jgi:hypothetical protein
MAVPGAPKVSERDLAANYGFALAVLNSDKSLKGLFKKAVSKQYTPERFQAELLSTPWFRQRSESQRKYQILKQTDPGKYVSQMRQLMSSLGDQWGELTGTEAVGVKPQLTTVKGKTTVTNGSGFLWTAADAALKFGWNESQIRDHLAKSFNWTKAVQQNNLGGSMSGQLQNWRAQAHALGIDPSDAFYASKLKDVASGNNTEQGIQARMKKLAAQRYKGFADDIEAGATMEDLTENYRESMGRILEIPPGQVDVFDRNIQKAVNRRNDKGDYEAMDIGSFEDELRKDKRWAKTQNAHDTLIGAGTSVLRSFGLVA